MKGKTITMKVTPEEYEAISAAARYERRKLGNFCIVCALERADRVRT